MNQQEFFKRYQYSPKQDKLGGGTFGKVFKAYDTVRNRYVAVKVAEVIEVGKKTLSLQDELNAVSNLPDHANIAYYEQVYQFETPQGDFDYAIMQYYPDGSLADVLEKEKLSFEQKEQIAQGILDGVAFLHKHKVTHRDLKPANILIVKHEGKYIPKIADFGLSKQAEVNDKSFFENSIKGGTIAYSSPEQLLGRSELHLNTDIWSVGVILYSMFTGSLPFNATEKSGSARDFEIQKKILQSPIPDAVNSIPVPYDDIVKQCLEKDPEKRVRRIEHLFVPEAEVVADEETEVEEVVAQEEETVVPPPPLPYPQPQLTVQDTPPSSDKNKGVWIGVVAVVLLLIGGIWWWQGGKGGSTPTPPVAERLDSLAYARLDKTNKDSIQHFIATYSQSAYVNDVNALLVAISLQEQQQIALQQAKKKQEQEAKQKAEAERKQQEEATRKAEQAEAERKQQEEAKRKAEEQKRKQNANVKYVKGVRFIKIPGKNFYMSETEVTIGQYLKFCKATNSHYPNWLQKGSEYNIYTGTYDDYKKVGMSESNTNSPITGVTWYDAVAYAKWLGGRLPTEEEWEYCANGGEHYTYAGSNNINEVAWYYENSGGRVHAVKSKRPNAYGLYDMSGNVWEWTSSKWSSSSSGRVLRGGSWDYSAQNCRSAYRSSNSPHSSINEYGFRLLISTD